MKMKRIPILPREAPFRLPTVFLILAITLLTMTAGCSSLNCTRLENLLGSDTDLITFAYSIADDLAARTSPPLIPGRPDMPILVTTLVSSDDLNQTSRFGRTVQEHINSRFVQLGFAVKEVKLTKTLQIFPRSGETMLSRNLALLSGTQEAQAVFAGTISHADSTLYISTRLIDPLNHNITASSDYKLCLDDTILAMFGLQRNNSGEDLIDEPSQPLLNSLF
jgi:TolB-like protein